MVKIQMKSVEKSYNNGTIALDKVDLDIFEGEFFVFVGPSGCSKSTLLRIIAGLETVTKGEVLISGKVVNKIAPKDRNLAMVFQNYALYPHMTVFHNISFYLRMKKKAKNKIESKVLGISKLLELDKYLNKMPNELSGGEKQRVAIGRALIKKPEIFLFDEPLSNLDAKLRAYLRIELMKFHKSLKLRKNPSTMVYVTHDQVEAMTMGDRICVLNFGKVMQVDTPYNLYHKPQNKFIASFIGSPTINFFKADIKELMFGESISFLSYTFLMPPNKIKTNDKVEKVWLGIRPEDIIISLEPPMAETIKGHINLIEKTGTETYIYVSVEGQNVVAKFWGESSDDIKYGLEVYLSINLEKAHIFEFFTEKNVSI